MKLDLFNVDDFVELNELDECTSGVLFQRGGVPHPRGLVSNEIFGITVQSRKETFAYIDLHGRFFHPHVYKVVRSVFRNIDKIISGDELYRINEDGILVLDRDNGDTGIDFIYNNWEKITWKKSGQEEDDGTVGMRNERMGFLNLVPKDEAFLTKIPVIPVFYRDIKTGAKGGKTGDINNYYANLIRLSTLMQNREMFGFQFGTTTYNIQQIIVSIYDLFKQKLHKKNGMIRKYLMGKTVDNAVRTVITAPTYHSERPTDMMVDFYHCAIPISQVCALAYSFMMAWIKGFIDREIVQNSLEKIVYNPNNDKIEKTVRLKDPAAYFNERWIETMMDAYIRDPSSRFNKIEIPVTGTSKKYYLHLTGKRLGNKAELSSVMYRPMTVTDLLYIAATEVTKDKMAMVTRYPILDEFSIFCNYIRVNSTTRTEPVMVNGRVYKWYPVIEFDTPRIRMASLFIDSLQFSNSYLAGLDGDYDGDQCTVKILYSLEANEEIKKYIHGVGNFVNATGKMIRVVESEAIQTFYTMTKEYEDGKALSAEKTEELLNMKEEDYTFTRFTKMIGVTSNMIDGTMSKPEYFMGDTMKIPAHYWNNERAITTTVGRFLWYQNVIHFTGLQDIIPFSNEIITASVCGKLEANISHALNENTVTTDTVVRYIDMRDWLGLQLHAVICTSFTPKILFLPKSLQDYKKKLIKDNEKQLKAGDPRAGELVEKELLNKAREVLKGDPGMDLYDSGARGSFGNNYKNINLIRGPVYNESTKKYDFIANSLMDGLKKTDFTPHSNEIVNGAYPKSIGTAESGYLGKEINAILQMEQLDPDPESDCGTKLYLEIEIPKYNTHQYDYRFILENGKLVCLTPDIISKYVGKKVKMRSVMFCKNEHKCSKCAGLYYYKTGKLFIGLQTSRISTTLSRGNMKKFHENLVKTSKIDPTDLLI